MDGRLLRSLFVATLLFAGLPTAPCPGTGCPCAPPEPAPASPCCPEEDACDACIYCVNCGVQAEAPVVGASAAPGGTPTRLAPASAIPAVEPVARSQAGPGPPHPGRTGPAPHVSRHVPSVVLRA